MDCALADDVWATIRECTRIFTSRLYALFRVGHAP